MCERAFVPALAIITVNFLISLSCIVVLWFAQLTEVRNWLLDLSPAGSAESPRNMLILYGPPGCGKSTCVRVLAREAGIDLKEWVDHGARGRFKPFEPSFRSRVEAASNKRADATDAK